MRFGFQINPYRPGPNQNPWDAIAQGARQADASALDSLWLYDHLLYEGGYSAHPYSEPVMECFTTLGAIAAITSRIRLGQLVLGTPYRNPALTAKMATTLDHLSHGRTILGLGAGWHRREYEAYGYGEWEEVPVRMRRLEEAIRLTLAFWTERPASFEGRYYQLRQAQENPFPVQRPHPPLLIGGSGEKVTLRLVAQYAQFCNVSGDVESVGRSFGILDEHCDRLGRPRDAVTRSIYATVLLGRTEEEVALKRDAFGPYIPQRGGLIGTPRQVVDMLGAYARVGCDYAIFRMPDWDDAEALAMFTDQVIPALAGA